MKPLNLDENAPWKQRFRAPSILYSLPARRNPQRGMVVTDQSGMYQLYAWETETGKLRQITHQPTGLWLGFISSDGRNLYYLKDDHGNELGHFMRVPFEGGEDEDLTPDVAPYSSWSLAESRDGSLLAFIAARLGGSEIYAVRDGKPVTLMKTTASARSVTLSADGKYVIVGTNERTGRNELSMLVLDAQSGERRSELFDDDATVEARTFSPIAGDQRVAGTTDVSGVSRPLIWNVETSERTDISLPGIEGEVYVWDWSPDAKTLLLCQISQAREQLYTYDIASGAVTKLSHPSGSYSFGYFASDDEIRASHSSTRGPSSLVALDAKTGAQKRVVLSAGDAPAGSSWRSVTFPSLDGTPIQGWLALPEGEGPFPTIIDIHGGPTGVQGEAYDPQGEAWVDHGFAWLTVNYRGSITFGKDFERAIWGRLGQVEVEDLVGARKWLVENRIAEPDSILLTGWSYGGYLTLQTSGRYPELWAGGMAGIAIADWTLMYEDQAETLRGYQRSLFGGTPQEKPESHAAASPITYAPDVKAPIIVIQGSNDTRCPPRQMRAYEDKMRSLGKPIELHWFEAGHGSLAMETRIEHQEIFMRFAYRVLG
jgi:dipeptidyl aminopeptidase/acylaminoacyl peptidase